MRKQLHWLFAALTLTVAVSITVQSAFAQQYTSVRDVLQNAELRQDFLVQGEYLAEVDGFKVGLHLIANGGGSFRVVAYPGGLPGDGWNAGEPRMLGTATLSGNEIAFDMTERRGTSAGQNIVMPERIETRGTIAIETPQRGPGQGGPGQGAVGQGGPRQGAGAGAGQFRNNPVAIEIPATAGMPAMTFEKQFRQSPTLGLAPPEGAIVIFDGTNLDMFHPNARMNEQQRGGNTLWGGAATAAPFEKRPYRLHLEFMLSFMPEARGQGRSNSGVYVDERYELQVLDSFGLEGTNDECGSFYQLAAPLINMCFPPLTWQTYDITFTPAQYDGDTRIVNSRVTILHNGVLIHDDLELERGTPGRRALGPEPLGLYIQAHGGRVQYRNIWMQYIDEPVVAQTQPVGVPPERLAPFTPTPPSQQVPIVPPVAQAQSVQVDPFATETVMEAVDPFTTTEETETEGAVVEFFQRPRRTAQPAPRPLFPRLRALMQ